MLRVLSIHAAGDIAGVSYAIADAFRRHPVGDILVRSAIRRPSRYAYPADLDWADAAAHWNLADVVHMHATASARKALRAPWRPFVLHHHGTRYRENTEALNAFIADPPAPARAVVATLDLLDLGPDLEWVPNPLDLDLVAPLRHPAPLAGRKLRVAHAPTNRTIKATDAFLAACDRVGVEPVLIERRTWADCLALKGTCDALYDQLDLGYGCNAVEAWAMRLPVIAGAAPGTLDRMRDTFGRLPFIDATGDTLADALALLRDEAARDEWAALGRAHAERWHDGRETVTRLTPIYRTLAQAA